MRRRFVILAHSGHGPLHYDLMLESGAALATWQLAVPPGEWREGAPLRARKLPDHRREYLDYEGPVSKDRGSVKRVDAGTFEIGRAEEELWEVTLDGTATRCKLELRRIGPGADAWELLRLNEPGPAKG
jgi:hypothetical protein